MSCIYAKQPVENLGGMASSFSYMYYHQNIAEKQRNCSFSYKKDKQTPRTRDPSQPPHKQEAIHPLVTCADWMPSLYLSEEPPYTFIKSLLYQSQSTPTAQPRSFANTAQWLQCQSALRGCRFPSDTAPCFDGKSGEVASGQEGGPLRAFLHELACPWLDCAFYIS
jgi:hypothetical protein